jgi:protein-tyrosine-phosphatase
MPDPLRVAFVCVQNAGRSQMAAAFARRERERRGQEGVEILSGGTHPADEVHPEAVAAMAEAGQDLSDETPTEIADSTLATCDYVATMGCSTLELPSHVDARDWALADPHGADGDRVRAIREEVEANVEALFDEIETGEAA